MNSDHVLGGSRAPTKQQLKPSFRVHSFPPHLTRFIGREKELADISALLSDPACRLLTLVGPGGIGKTRLALQAATEASANFADGIFFVALQSVRTPNLLPFAIADAVSLSLHGREYPEVQLLNYLRDKKLLLVLDNFEHLLEDIGLLTAILTTAPSIQLLVTSREVLNLQEEWRYPVHGMEVPSNEHTDGDVENRSAVRLFVERARRMRPDFSLTDEQADVVRICQLVEGMPLAIELAAAWVSILSCNEIAKEIEKSLDFLTTTLRDGSERHRSIQAVFEQSLQLLGEEERDVFNRLSVFRGGFRRAAAEQVAGATLSSLMTLVEKSLLRWEPEGRFQIHELLRQYAAEQLMDLPEKVARMHDLHCAYYADFLHQRSKDMIGGQQREAMIEIATERENIRTAWDWAVEQTKLQEIQRLAYTLHYFYDFQSRYLEAADAFEKAVHSLESSEPTGQKGLTLAEILVYQGWFCIRIGRLEKAKAVLERSHTIFKDLRVSPPAGLGTDPLIALGVLACVLGDYTKAVKLAEESRQRNEARVDKANLAVGLYVLTCAYIAQGKYEVARKYAERSYALTKEIGDRWFKAYCLIELGNIARALGEFAEARHHYQSSYALREEFGDPEGMAVALNHLGKIAVQQEDYLEAQKLYGRSLAIYQEIGDRGGLATAFNGLGMVACGLGKYREARYYFHQALQIAVAIHFLPLILAILTSICELLLHTRQLERWLELLQLILHHPASDRETVDRTQQLLVCYRAECAPNALSAAAQPRQASDLNSITARLLVELSTPSMHIEVASFSPNSQADQPDAFRTQPLIDPLTEREREVLQLIANGLSNQQIAQELILSVGTVKWHIHQIYSKLNVKKRTQAIARARELDLLP
jgi:predicted ATPase/DNA-binding CsgD family transcriptional regulator